MIDDAPSPETPEPVADSRPLSAAERIFVRISIWQTVLSVAGVFTGAVALYAALNESEAVRRQSAAEVWPFVQLIVSDHVDDASAHFSLTLTNAGVGPARIETARVTFDGEPVRDWSSAVAKYHDGPAPEINQSFVTGRVLSPGEPVRMFHTEDRALVMALQEVLAGGRSQLEYCYCSIFDACWLADSAGDIQHPEPVRVCPDFGETEFQH